MTLEGSMRRPDRIVRILTAFASFAYYAIWFGAALALGGLLMVKVFLGFRRGAELEEEQSLVV
jgi:hypothetical protein